LYFAANEFECPCPEVSPWIRQGKPDHLQRLEIWKLYTQKPGVVWCGAEFHQECKAIEHTNHILMVDTIHIHPLCHKHG
jgi:hypothetical protein